MLKTMWINNGVGKQSGNLCVCAYIEGEVNGINTSLKEARVVRDLFKHLTYESSVFSGMGCHDHFVSGLPCTSYSSYSTRYRGTSHIVD
jgi:hypothetical protein